MRAFNCEVFGVCMVCRKIYRGETEARECKRRHAKAVTRKYLAYVLHETFCLRRHAYPTFSYHDDRDVCFYRHDNHYLADYMWWDVYAREIDERCNELGIPLSAAVEITKTVKGLWGVGRLFLRIKCIRSGMPLAAALEIVKIVDSVRYSR